MVKDGWYVCEKCGKKLLKLDRESVLYGIPVYCHRCKNEWWPTIYAGAELDEPDIILIPVEDAG